MYYHLYLRQLPLSLHLFIQACLRVKATGNANGFSRRSFRFPVLSGIARYATVSDLKTGDRRIASGNETRRLQNPFPYPTHAKPTPHQIFHLGPGATQQQIKERYYDLVRTHHPDSFHARLSVHNPVEAHSRFRSIKAAYDFLRGRTISPDPNATAPPPSQNFDPYMHEMARRRRAYNASRNSSGKTEWAEGFGAPKKERGEWNENGKKERLILSFGVVALVGGLFPSLPLTLVSIFFPTSTLPSSLFPFSLFGSSLTLPSSFFGSPPFTQLDSPPSVPSSSSVFSFFLGFDKTHRAAAALSEARKEARDMAVERREGVRKRVKQMAREPAAAAERESTTLEQ